MTITKAEIVPQKAESKEFSLEKFAAKLVDLYMNPNLDDNEPVERFLTQYEEQSAAFIYSSIIDFAEDYLKDRGLM